MADEQIKACRKAITVIHEARAWIAPKNLDPDHHHYDPRAVAFASRCDEAIQAFRRAGLDGFAFGIEQLTDLDDA
jgi:hypothetical protein